MRAPFYLSQTVHLTNYVTRRQLTVAAGLSLVWVDVDMIIPLCTEPLSVFACEEELLASDFVVLIEPINGDLFECAALAGALDVTSRVT